MCGVIAFVADHPAAWRCRGEQRRGALDVGDMSAAQKERMRPAFFVDERMDFCRPSAARAANGRLFSPLLRQQLSDGP